jgi:hypothetical protein
MPITGASTIMHPVAPMRQIKSALAANILVMSSPCQPELPTTLDIHAIGEPGQATARTAILREL